MFKTAVGIFSGIVLAVVGTMLAALVVGERNKRKRDSPGYNSLGKAINVCLVILILLVAAILFISFWFSLWFLLTLIPITLFSAIGLRLDPEDPLRGSRNRYVTREDYNAIQSRWKSK